MALLSVYNKKHRDGSMIPFELENNKRRLKTAVITRTQDIE